MTSTHDNEIQAFDANGELQAVDLSGAFTTRGDLARARRLTEYKRLIDRYGFDRVLRHVGRIVRALDTREARP